MITLCQPVPPLECSIFTRVILSKHGLSMNTLLRPWGSPCKPDVWIHIFKVEFINTSCVLEYNSLCSGMDTYVHNMYMYFFFVVMHHNEDFQTNVHIIGKLSHKSCEKEMFFFYLRSIYVEIKLAISFYHPKHAVCPVKYIYVSPWAMTILEVRFRLCCQMS